MQEDFWNGEKTKKPSAEYAVFSLKKVLQQEQNFIALLLFVGIPVPGTGAWTGTLAASLLDMKFKDTVIAVTLGVLLAGCIMMAGSLGLFSALFSFIK